MNLTRKSIPNNGGIKSKTFTTSLDRFMNGRVELWKEKEITTIVTGTIKIRRKKDMEQNT